MKIRQGLKFCFNVSIKTSYVKHAVHMKGACQRKPLTLCLQAKTRFPQVESTFNELMSSFCALGSATPLAATSKIKDRRLSVPSSHCRCHFGGTFSGAAAGLGG